MRQFDIAKIIKWLRELGPIFWITVMLIFFAMVFGIEILAYIWLFCAIVGALIIAFSIGRHEIISWFENLPYWWLIRPWKKRARKKNHKDDAQL